MKKIILKLIENQRIKYEKLYCKHDWIKNQSWNSTDIYTKVKKEDAIILYICKKCGNMKKVEI